MNYDYKNFIEQAGLELSDDENEFLRDAFDFARECHKGQSRDDGETYFNHPYRVALYAAVEMQIKNPEVIAAALLHDVIEDCRKVDFDVIVEKFGRRTAEMVSMLSKPGKKPGLSRNDRNAEYYKQLDKADEEVLKIKIADRVDNVRSLKRTGDKSKIKRYIIQTRKIYIPIAKKIFPEAAELMEKILEQDQGS